MSAPGAPAARDCRFARAQATSFVSLDTPSKELHPEINTTTPTATPTWSPSYVRSRQRSRWLLAPHAHVHLGMRAA